MAFRRKLFHAVVAFASTPALVRAQVPHSPCPAAIAAAEAQMHIPDAFLSAMGQVESGRPDPGNGQTKDSQFKGAAKGAAKDPSAARTPWPWTINAMGQGHFYASKAEAVAAARQFLASGVQSIDVGCLQINLFYHPAAFASLDQAFDPQANADFAARMLLGLFQQTGSWPRAAAAYHSMTPALGQLYERKVLDAWAAPDPRLPYRAADASSDGTIGAQALPAAERVATSAVARPRLALTATEPIAAAPPPVAARARGMELPVSPGAMRATSPGANPVSNARTLALYRAFPVRLAFQPPPVRRVITPKSSLPRIR